MNSFIDCLTDESRAIWYALMHEMGLVYKSKDKKRMVEINTKLEDIEEIAVLMTESPVEYKTKVDDD